MGNKQTIFTDEQLDAYQLSRSERRPRSEEMFGLAAKISHCLLPLLLLREAAGATFFLQYETVPMTQNCNASFEHGDAAWWAGQHNSSLQKFERWCGYPNESHSPSSSKNKHENCPNNFSWSHFHRGGIFACITPPILQNANPVFTSKENCTNFNFFVVAIVKSPKEQRSENIHRKIEENISIKEQQNFTLSCEFEPGKDTTTFAVYWFKETTPSKCLFSASNEDTHAPSIVFYDVNCCIDDAFRGRRINGTISPQNQTYAVIITNSTMADNGVYLCVVAAYNRGYTWTIERRISVNVRKASPQSSNVGFKISLAAITAAVLLMGGIILFLCCKKKAKGKPLENQQRDQTTVATEDCSPYAVSSRNDLNAEDLVYSLATGPGEGPSAVCFSQQSKPAASMQLGENVEALYSKVLKDKNDPSLVSNSSV
ncbi:uncharacterized protein LOC113442390 [Pseudonaja textilis]|uniref:uncharacterized protein LOC113442390 n=1 Tax=Pseudonaja textilis TaxID=8673 RepID=UPI000EA908B3|nr:uncharacterized protein LOC113442390 [Pseudonaja textilis]